MEYSPEDLAQISAIHRKPLKVVTLTADERPIIPEQRFGGNTDLSAADDFTGTGTGTIKRTPESSLD